jgi:hypothetical protein
LRCIWGQKKHQTLVVGKEAVSFRLYCFGMGYCPQVLL